MGGALALEPQKVVGIDRLGDGMARGPVGLSKGKEGRKTRQSSARGRDERLEIFGGTLLLIEFMSVLSLRDCHGGGGSKGSLIHAMK